MSSRDKKKSNISDTIRLIRKNKKYFLNVEDYEKILTNLYNEFSSNCGEGEEEDTILSKEFKINICRPILTVQKYNNFVSASKSYHHAEFVSECYKLGVESKFPLISLFYIESKYILAEEINLTELFDTVQKDPLINIYNKTNIVTIIRMFLNVCENAFTRNAKIISLIIIYDTLFRNFKFCLDNHRFFQTSKDKINTIIENDMNHLIEFEKKYNFDIKIFENWAEILNNTQLN